MMTAERLHELYSQSPTGLQTAVVNALEQWEHADIITVEIGSTQRYTFLGEIEPGIDRDFNRNITQAVELLKTTGGVGYLPIDDFDGSENIPPEIKKELMTLFAAVVAEIGGNLKGCDVAEVRRRWGERMVTE
ncbi:MAG: hypothetical protein FWH07_08085 [Oscillospiraceae bacterium]|nr:hypothetical protein [Oscillospiraceae bacterium]